MRTCPRRSLCTGTLIASVLALSGCVATGLSRPAYITPQGDTLPPRSAGAETMPAGDVDFDFTAPMDLDDLLRLARVRNPEIAAARAQVRAAGGERWQAELLPNPTLEFEAEEVPAGDIGLQSSVNTFSISQPIPIGGRRRAGVAAATAHGESRRHQLATTTNDVLGRVRAAFTELLYLRASERVHRELLELTGQTADAARSRFEARAAPESEHLKAQVEVEKLRLDLDAVTHQRRATLEKLRGLLGGARVTDSQLRGELSDRLNTLDAGALADWARQRHPEVLAAEQDVLAAEHTLARIKAERIPDVELRVGGGRDTAEGTDIVGAGVSVPLPLFNRNQGAIVAAESRVDAARRVLETTRNRIVADLAQLTAEHEQARQRTLAHRDRITPAAVRALDMARDQYRAGRGDLLGLLDSQRTVAEARLSLLGGIRDSNLAQSRVWQLLGRIDPNHDTKEGTDP